MEFVCKQAVSYSDDHTAKAFAKPCDTFTDNCHGDHLPELWYWAFGVRVLLNEQKHVETGNTTCGLSSA